MIDIAEIADPAELNDPIIRNRASASRLKRSRQFIALTDGKEAGYLSFDDRLDIETGILYDLFVLPQFRRRGVGSALVDAGHKLARSLGYRKTRVSPTAFDGSVDQQWLTGWYRAKGYEPAADGTGEYEKPLG